MAGSGDGSAFGELLRCFRLRAALTQDDLAARSGLSARGISDLERGARRTPYLGTIRRLADALTLDDADRAALIAARHAEPGAVTGALAAAPPLPMPLTPLIDRDQEVAAVAALLRAPDARLITLTGPGGVGKTRVALAVAAAVMSSFDAIHVIDLSAVRLPERLSATVIEALGMSALSGEPAAVLIARATRGRRLLLVLDNFEHLLAATTSLAEMLALCPDLTVLVTSRARLRIRGEREHAVPPLPLPTASHEQPVEELATISAVRLFVARAQDVQPSFTLTSANAAAVAGICRRLDGLPLAIELAAARIAILPPVALFARLERRLPLLTGGARDLPHRLRTLRDAIAWSHDLLTREEQTLFRRLAVFSGGFSLAAAEAVAGDEGMSSLALLDQVTSLVEHSLLRQVEDAESQPRFVMLETIREHAQERLDLSGEDEAMQARHAAYYRELADEAARAFIRPDRAAWVDRVQIDHGNVLAALRWYLARQDGESSLRMVNGLYTLWHWRGQLAEYREWSRQALAVSAGQSSALRAEVVDLVAELALQQGDAEEAARLYAEALADATAAGDAEGIARARLRAGQSAFALGDLERARNELEAARAAFQEIAFPLWEAAALGELGRVARAMGQPALAAAPLDQALALYRQGHYVAAISWIKRIQGLVAADLGDRRRACALLAEALTMEHGKRGSRPIADCLTVLADIAQRDRQPRRAARLLGAAETLREHVGAIVQASDRADYQRILAAVRAGLDEGTLAETWAAGRGLSMDDAVAEALAYASGSDDRVPASQDNGSSRSQDGLTLRELTVLRLVTQGRTDQEIAGTLSISRRTVTTHITSILTKLRVANRVEAAAWAARHDPGS